MKLSYASYVLSAVVSMAALSAVPAAASELAASAAHEITARVGFVSNVGTEFSGPTYGVSATTGGVLGTIQYDYWIKDEWAIGLSAGAVDAGTDFSIENGVPSSSVASVAMLHLGATYRPAALAITPDLRPFVSLSAGPYIGSFVGQSGWFSGASTSTSAGLRALVGLDLRFARHFKVGIAGGYHLIGEFDELGTTTDYSQPEFSIGFGVGFGGV